MSSRTRLSATLLLLLALAGCNGSAPAPSSPPVATITAAPLAQPTTQTSSTRTPGEATPTPVGSPTMEQPAARPTPTSGAEPSSAPSGVEMRKLLETGGGFVRLAVNPQDGQIYYMDSTARIFQVERDAEGARGRLVYDLAAIGGSTPTTGMAFGPDGSLYVVSNRVDEAALTMQGIIRKGVPDGSGDRTWSTLAATEPYPLANNPFNHAFNGVVASPDGAFVYVNSGSRTDHGEVQSPEGRHPGVREVPLTSAIFRLPADAQDLTLPNDEAALREAGYLFADGFRNAYDLAFSAAGELFAADNGPDGDYDDELNLVEQGQHYGFPWRMGAEDNPQQHAGYDPSADVRIDPAFSAAQQGTYHDDPGFPVRPVRLVDPIPNLGPDADQYRAADGSIAEASDGGRTLATFTAHRSPLGLVFDLDQALPEPFRGDAFVLSFGGGSKAFSDRGQDLLHLELERSGAGYQARVSVLKSGFKGPIDSVILDGKLYVLDMGGAGAIWELEFAAAGA